jgi:hypothetical protein
VPTPVFLTGFEHGVVATGATPAPNDRIWHTVVTTGGTPGIDTATPRSGVRCLNIPATSGSGSYVGRNLASGSPKVASFGVRFVGSLPTADCYIFALLTSGSWVFVRFQSSDSKLYTAAGANLGATGITVAADTWYRVDVRAVANGTTTTMEMEVDGTAAGTASLNQAASAFTSFRIGKNVDTGTTANGNIRFDDLVITETSGDYPLGDHEVLKMSPNADGTHSFTANDFIRGDSGAAILTSDTDVNTLVDDVPFAAIGTTDSVQQNVIRSTGYVELALEAAPQAVDAWGIQIHGQYDADATGADTCTLKENDGGTLRDVYTNADVSNTSETFLSHCKATAPSGGAYTQSILDALKLRWGFSTDVTGSPIVHALMVEVAYPVAAGPTVVEADGSAAGAATVASVAAALWNGVTAAAGVAASVVAGAMIVLIVASAPGVAAGAATSAIVQEGAGASAGMAAASGVGALVLPSQGASTGAAAGSAEGADGASGGQGVATGAATVTGVSAATAGADASAAAAATGAASGTTVFLTQGGAAGLASAQADGVDANAGTNAQASGTSQAAAISGVTAGAEARASGSATVLGVADAPPPPAVESGSGGISRRRIFRGVMGITMTRPVVRVQGWASVPAHASLALRWTAPLVDASGGSIPAFRGRIAAMLEQMRDVRITAQAEPPEFDLSDDALLFLADQFFNG